MKEEIIKEFKNLKFSPPKYTDMVAKQKDKAGFKMVYDSLIDQSIIIRLNEECTLLNEDYNSGKELIKKYIIENGSIAAGSARELLNTNRKYAVAILEHLDSIKFTKRIENDRVLF
ncbi:Selenocysteine-specific elongation factor [bioreactor metagenome]|uniref:Selenocysteine-specific elongation factor n=1 Tax=bioreactor metagenome TaxID=1076179 RepID=A0A645HGX1_9ZZZZ